MKLGILTVPLGNNYGGLLQAYALQTTLNRLGHETCILRRIHDDRIKSVIRNLRNLTYSIIGKFYVSQIDKLELSKNMIYFANQYINTKSPLLKTTKALELYCKNSKLDGIIVGSDQVWRPSYSPCITNFFFDFIEKRKIKKISYAASFGVDTWTFSDKETQRCKELIKLFDGVSVREDSGVDLCKQYLDCNAISVLDPTFLLKKEDYIKLVELEKEPKKTGELFCYVLDKSKQKTELINLIAKKTHFFPYFCMPKHIDYSEMTLANKADFKYPPVTQWIRSFMDAKMVVTDSFHGCVFSIIFNKPFWVVANENRGATRFTSLLNRFGLENRLLNDLQNYSSIDWDENIDWEAVSEKRTAWEKESLNYLISSLS